MVRERRVRRVAGYWYDAAGAALWYRLAAFNDAEQAAYQALQRAARGEWNRRDTLVLRGKIQDAQVEDDYQNHRDLKKAVLQVAKGYNAALKGKPYQEPAAVTSRSTPPLTIKDQADLRWLLSQDWQWLMIQATMLATARSASARRPEKWRSTALQRPRGDRSTTHGPLMNLTLATVSRRRYKRSITDTTHQVR